MVKVEVVDSPHTLVSVLHHMALLLEYTRITIRLHLHCNLYMVHIYIYVYILAIGDTFVRGNIPLI
jgi:hypothetical protein